MASNPTTAPKSAPKPVPPVAAATKSAPKPVPPVAAATKSAPKPVPPVATATKNASKPTPPPPQPSTIKEGNGAVKKSAPPPKNTPPPTQNAAAVPKKRAATTKAAAAPVAAAAKPDTDKALAKVAQAGALVLSKEKMDELRMHMISFTTDLDAADNELKNQKQLGLQINIPLFIIGVSKKQGMYTAIVPHLGQLKDLVDGLEVQGLDSDAPYLETVIDIRTRDDREEDQNNGLAIEDQTIYPEQDVAGLRDDAKEIRRVLVRFSSMGGLKLLNKSDSALEAGTFAMCKVEPGAWRDKKTNQITVLSKLVGVTRHTRIPIGPFVNWMHQMGARTKHFVTKAGYYAQTMARLSLEYGTSSNIPENEAMSTQFRSDNEFILTLGFGHGAYLNRYMQESNSCYYMDTTENKDSNFEGVNFDNKSVKENRYLMELTGIQWTNGENDPPGYLADTARLTKFCLKVGIFKPIIDKLEILSISAWRSLGPVNMPYFPMLLHARENAKVSFDNALTRNRVDTSDPDAVNESAGGNRVSFVMGTFVDSLLMDPVDAISRVTFPVSADTVRWLWNEKSIPPVEKDTPSVVLKDDKPLICLSEIKGDVARILKNPNYELRIMTNARGTETLFGQDEFGKLSVQDGNLMAHYLVDQLVRPTMKSREQYLASRNLKLKPDHILLRYNFQFVGPKKILYVFAINKTKKSEVHSEFFEFAKTLPVAQLFLTNGDQENNNNNSTPLALEGNPPANGDAKRGTKRPAAEADLPGAPAGKQLRNEDGEAVPTTPPTQPIGDEDGQAGEEDLMDDSNPNEDPDAAQARLQLGEEEEGGEGDQEQQAQEETADQDNNEHHAAEGEEEGGGGDDQIPDELELDDADEGNGANGQENTDVDNMYNRVTDLLDANDGDS